MERHRPIASMSYGVVALNGSSLPRSSHFLQRLLTEIVLRIWVGSVLVCHGCTAPSSTLICSSLSARCFLKVGSSALSASDLESVISIGCKMGKMYERVLILQLLLGLLYYSILKQQLSPPCT